VTAAADGAGPADILVVYDDVNLPLGALRVRPGGGAGGHHGLASCLEALGTEAIPRLRIGVGSEAMPRDLAGFVLTEFDPSERPIIAQAVARAADACEWWVRDGIQTMMNKANQQER
jgi:PTH1 family peptidyl-tRNA hydrolase